MRSLPRAQGCLVASVGELSGVSLF